MTQEELFDAYWRNELSLTERRRLEHLLATDEAMKRAWEDHRDLLESVQIEGWKSQLKEVHKEWEIQEDLKPHVAYPKPLQILMMAAMIALLVAAWWAFRSEETPSIASTQLAEPVSPTEPKLSNTPSQTDVESGGLPTKATTEKAIPDLQQFEPLAYLEGQLSRVLRGSSSFEVKAPVQADSLTTGNSCLFHWSGREGQITYLKILNNKGRPMIEKETKQSSISVTLPDQPGLYYWQLESEDDLIYLHKFTCH